MRAVALAILVVSLGAGAVTGRAAWEGRRALAEAEEAREAGDRRGAIEAYRGAARWYLPGARHTRAAYDGLEALAREAEAEGDRGGALAAWQGVRGAALATRSAVFPFEDVFERASARIAALRAAEGRAFGEPDPGGRAREADYREALERVYRPSPGWLLVALMGLALWLAGGVAFAARAVSDEGFLARRPAIAAGVFAASGLIFWLLGLARA